MSIIKTERLVLRPFKEGDAEDMYKNWTFDERVAKYCRWYPHENIETTKWLLNLYLDESQETYKYRWAITLINSNEPIGAIDLVDISEDGKTASVGYVLSYDYWNKGIVSEALKSVIEYLFQSGFSKVAAQHHIENNSSGRVMQKCGMNFVGYDKLQEKFGSDKLCDVKCYEISKHF